MKIKKTSISDCIIIEPEVFGDDRGFFYESYHLEKYTQYAGIDSSFVQDNFSRSQKNVLRGLHYQKTKPQGKLVRVARGEVYDVAVDIRKNSSTYGHWEGVTLSEKNKSNFGYHLGLHMALLSYQILQILSINALIFMTFR